jgi:hypothetical protein
VSYTCFVADAAFSGGNAFVNTFSDEQSSETPVPAQEEGSTNDCAIVGGNVGGFVVGALSATVVILLLKKRFRPSE